MKKTEKEIENLIVESLNSDKPDSGVIREAEQIMLAQLNNEASKKAFNVKKLIAVFTPCIAVALVLICCIPLFINRGQIIIDDEDLTPTSLVSIQSYNETTGNTVLYMDYAVINCTLYSDSEQTPIYLCEVYTDGGTEISLYAILTETQTEISIMDKFENLSQSTVLEGIAVSYGYVNAEYRAKCTYGNYEYLLSASGIDEETLMQYVFELVS